MTAADYIGSMNGRKAMLYCALILRFAAQSRIHPDFCRFTGGKTIQLTDRETDATYNNGLERRNW